jgi:hypothetical protein
MTACPLAMRNSACLRASSRAARRFPNENTPDHPVVAEVVK